MIKNRFTSSVVTNTTPMIIFFCKYKSSGVNGVECVLQYSRNDETILFIVLYVIVKINLM